MKYILTKLDKTIDWFGKRPTLCHKLQLLEIIVVALLAITVAAILGIGLSESLEIVK